MTSTTTNYNLTLYDSVTDAGELFLDYRTDMAGTTGSNMTKLDAALTAIQVSIDALELSKGATFVNASFDSGSLFTATGISGITAYDTNLKIILQLDQDSDGTVTLNINSLGVKSVYGINNAGTATNLVGAHLKDSREYYLRYNGTVWIVVSDTENPSVWTKNTETLATTKTLTDYSETIQYLDPDGVSRDIELPAEADSNPIFYIVNEAGTAFNLVVKDDSPATILTLNQNETGLFISDGVAWKGFLIEDANTYLQNVVEDTSPQLGGDLDLNGNAIDFPTTANVDDVLDEDDMSSDSATKLATQQSIKAYVDNQVQYVRRVILDPNTVYTGTTDVPIFRSEAAITITRIHISGNDATPTAELDVNLRFTTSLTAISGTLINACDTTSGVFTKTSGFTDATVPANRYVYWDFDAQPHADWTFMYFEVYYTVD